MITEKEVQEGIMYCQIGQPTPEKIAYLAAYLIVRDCLFGKAEPAYEQARFAPQENYRAEKLQTRGNTEFLAAVNRKDPGKVMSVVEEVMDAVKVLQPKLYNSVMQKISEI